jgi:hypothetical protein
LGARMQLIRSNQYLPFYWDWIVWPIPGFLQPVYVIIGPPIQ